jgi:hypothetical protein
MAKTGMKRLEQRLKVVLNDAKEDGIILRPGLTRILVGSSGPSVCFGCIIGSILGDLSEEELEMLDNAERMTEVASRLQTDATTVRYLEAGFEGWDDNYAKLDLAYDLGRKIRRKADADWRLNRLSRNKDLATLAGEYLRG